MDNIKIEDDLESMAARLSVVHASLGWKKIRRYFFDCSNYVQEISDVELLVPWWIFINRNEDFKQYLSIYNLQVDIQDNAKSRLVSSLKNKSKFGESKDEDIDANEIDSILRKKGFKRHISEFQKENLEKLLKFNSAADFSVPGAGKTTDALAFYCFKRKEGNKLLVVCPRNAFAVWVEQIDKCFGNGTLRCLRLEGGSEKVKKLVNQDINKLSGHAHDVYLINYEILPNVSKDIAHMMLNDDYFMILDESHRIKGTGIRSTSVLELSHLPLYKLILSGTPMPNSIDDLVPQFSFLYPEIRIDENSVGEKIQNIYVRTTKSKLKIPDVNEFQILIPLSSHQRQFYDLLTNEAVRQVNIKDANKRNMLRRISKSVMRLLQLTSNPTILLDTEWADEPLFSAVLDDGDSPKLKYVCKKARELANNGQKVIIWSSFVKNVELIARRLSDIGAVYIHGGVTTGSVEEDHTREAKISRFHNLKDDVFALVANPAACGESISLHEVCHHAIYLDRNYNAAQYLQSKDRIHRYGMRLDTKTTIEFLVSPSTIDERVIERLNAKIDKMSQVLNDQSLNTEIETVIFDESYLSDEEADIACLGLDSDDMDDFKQFITKPSETI